MQRDQIQKQIDVLRKELEKTEKVEEERVAGLFKTSGLQELYDSLQNVKVKCQITEELSFEGEGYYNYHEDIFDWEDRNVILNTPKDKIVNPKLYKHIKDIISDSTDSLYDIDDLDKMVLPKDIYDKVRTFPSLVEKFCEKNNIDADIIDEYFCN